MYYTNIILILLFEEVLSPFLFLFCQASSAQNQHHPSSPHQHHHSEINIKPNKITAVRRQIGHWLFLSVAKTPW